MKFISTRGGEKVSGAEAIVKGLAENGGLYVPEKFPKISLEEMEKMGIQRKKEAIAKGEAYKPRSHKNNNSMALGRPTVTAEQIPQKFIEIYTSKMYDSIADLARKCECSRTTVYKYQRLLGKPTMKEAIRNL